MDVGLGYSEEPGEGILQHGKARPNASACVKWCLIANTRFHEPSELETRFALNASIEATRAGWLTATRLGKSDLTAGRDRRYPGSFANTRRLSSDPS